MRKQWANIPWENQTNPEFTENFAFIVYLKKMVYKQMGNVYVYIYGKEK